MYRITLSTGLISVKNTDPNGADTIYNDQGSTVKTPAYVEVDTDKLARTVSYWRGTAWPTIYLNKMVVIGTFCDSVDEPLESSYSQ